MFQLLAIFFCILYYALESLRKGLHPHGAFLPLFCVSCPWTTVLYWIAWQVCKFAILLKCISLALHEQRLPVALKLQAEKAENIAPGRVFLAGSCFSSKSQKKRRTSGERHGRPVTRKQCGYLALESDCAGTNSSLSFRPIPAARRLSVRSDGFAVPLSSLQMFVW